MSQERITLYHATDKLALDAMRDAGALFGYEHTPPLMGYSGESNLTPDKDSSLMFITAYRGGGQWTLADGPPELFLLELSIPADEVKAVGQTHILRCDEYASTLTVDVDDVPDQYLQRLHAGMHRMSRERARDLQVRGKIRFYQVPLDYLTKIEPV